MTFETALRLGRVSNLPTVWTNVLAGMVLAGGTTAAGTVARLVVAASSFYVGGMWLNDAFDREADARERSGRPIPSGAARPATVFAGGFAMLAAGVALVVPYGPRAALCGLGLAAAIVLYDAWHRENAFAPVVMGACRALVYLTAGAAAVAGIAAGAGLGAGGADVTAGAVVPWPLLGGAAAVWVYVIGLTFVARRETFNALESAWPLALLAAPAAYAAAVAGRTALGVALVVAFGAWVLWALARLWRPERRDVPGAVVRLIAGISLLDAVLLAGGGAPRLAAAAAAATALTRVLQRWVPGT